MQTQGISDFNDKDRFRFLYLWRKYKKELWGNEFRYTYKIILK